MTSFIQICLSCWKSRVC